MAIRSKFSKKDFVDSGLALLLITLITGLLFEQLFIFKIALVEVIVLLILPAVFFPFTFLWLNFSDLLGKIMSKVILAVIFFVFVCPVAFLRNILGKDTLKLRRFKKDTASVFTDRDKDINGTNFTVPY